MIRCLDFAGQAEHVQMAGDFAGKNDRALKGLGAIELFPGQVNDAGERKRIAMCQFSQINLHVYLTWYI